MRGGNKHRRHNETPQLRLRGLPAKPRPQSIDPVKDQGQDQGKKGDAHYGMSDSSMMEEIRPAISKEQNGYITVGKISGEDANGSRPGRESFQACFGRSQTDE
jgi:hypothetical protein